MTRCAIEYNILILLTYQEGYDPGKEATMQVNTGALKNVCEGLHIDGKHLRSWKQKNLTKERLAEIALLASTTTVLGYIVWWAARAADSYRVLGLG